MKHMKKRELRTTEQSISDLMDTIKHPNVCVTGATTGGCQII